MNVYKAVQNGTLAIGVDGALDADCAARLHAEIENSLETVKDPVLDFTNLNDLSSDGLRVILSAQKNVNALKGTLVIKNVNETVMEVFAVTGFLDILRIE